MYMYKMVKVTYIRVNQPELVSPWVTRNLMRYRVRVRVRVRVMECMVRHDQMIVDCT